MPVADAHDHAAETETEQLLLVIEPTEDGWYAAHIEGTGAFGQGRTQDEARRNVLAALHDLAEEPTWAERVLYRLRSLRADLRDHLPAH
jgi:hypothetical protein